VVAWLLWEHGRFLIEPAYDRVSIVHVVALVSGTLALAALASVEKRLVGRLRKAMALAVAGLFAAGVIGATYPDFFLGPWPHLDPVLVAWHQQIGELQPLLPHDGFGLAAFLAQMTAPLLALVFVVARLWRGPEADKPMLLLSLIGFVLFGALALVQMRWSGEVQAVMLLPWTLATIAIMESKIRLAPLQAFALAGVLLLQVLATMATQSQKGLNQFTTHPTGICRWSAAARAVGASVADNAILMAPVWYGPEILWRSNVKVIAGPYEMPAAMTDTAQFLHGSAAAARAITVKRGISYALVCKSDNWPGFGGELAVGRHPDWLRETPLKNGPKEFRLYRVVR
jgi:hypothetical protein